MSKRVAPGILFLFDGLLGTSRVREAGVQGLNVVPMRYLSAPASLVRKST